MYMPYAAVYYVERVHLMCSINAACHHLTMSDYFTTEIIVMALGVVLHIPLWFFILLLLDIKKSGGKISDFFKYYLVSLHDKYFKTRNLTFRTEFFNSSSVPLFIPSEMAVQ